MFERKDRVRRCAAVDSENAGTCQVSSDMADEVLGPLRRRMTSEG